MTSFITVFLFCSEIYLYNQNLQESRCILIYFFHYIYNTENLCDKVINNEKGAVKDVIYLRVKRHPELSRVFYF